METRDRLARRFRIEVGLATATAVLFVLTLFSREWIEALTGWDPDRGSGALEWLVVGALLVVTVALATRARADWRSIQAVPA